MKKIALLGLGKVGSLVGVLLSSRFEVLGIDQKAPHYDYTLPFPVIELDVSDEKQLRKGLADCDAVFSALPYFLNQKVVEIAVELDLHYFDLSEDVPTTKLIQKLAQGSDRIFAPQCGLAPGFIGIVGADLAKRFNKIRDIELRVGALPQFPNGQLAYSFTWSPAGVINEYLNDAEVIHNGVRKMAPSLDGLEHINIGGMEFEAFTTSGGLGTMCETYEGKVDTLNYKTMRYPGHMQLMKFFLYELILKRDKKLAEEILTYAKPPVQEDVVYVYAVVEGWKNDKLHREEYFHDFYPLEIEGKRWRAISWTTAASAVAVVEMAADGKLTKGGFVKQEDIDLQAFLSTKTGSYYAQ